MQFDFEKFRKVCEYNRAKLHTLDINTPSRDDFLMFLDQHEIHITEYAKDIGYICWNADKCECWGVNPEATPLDYASVTVHTMSDFMLAIHIDNDAILDFLGV